MRAWLRGRPWAGASHRARRRREPSSASIAERYALPAQVGLTGAAASLALYGADVLDLTMGSGLLAAPTYLPAAGAVPSGAELRGRR